MICLAMVWRRPEDETALPNVKPPAARMMMVQRKLLKSSFVRIPVPKKRTRGIIAITPMSPNTLSSWWDVHHNAMVKRVTPMMKY